MRSVFRRDVLVCASTIATMGGLAGCISTSNDWTVDASIPYVDADRLEEPLGEVEAGDEVELEVELHRGEQLSVSLVHRNAIDQERFWMVVVDSEEADAYDPDEPNVAVSPATNTFEVTEPGQYYVWIGSTRHREADVRARIV